MKHAREWITVGLAALALTAGCKSTRDKDQEPREEILYSFEMEWPQRERDEVGRRALAVAELMAGRELGDDVVVEPLTSPEGVVRRWKVTIPRAPAIRIRYLPEFDELRMLNDEVAVDRTPMNDVGEKAALKLVRDYLVRLDQAKVVRAAHFDLANAQVGYTRVAEGALDGSRKSEDVTEYRVTLRRTINGLQVANAGIRFAVHATGRLAGVRLGGVEVRSLVEGGVEKPLGDGVLLQRRVDRGEVDKRFDAGLPRQARADLEWSRLMYVMPEGAKKAVVAPMQVFSYSLEFPTAEGPSVISRRKTVGYSVTEAGAAMVDFSPAAKSHESPQVTRDS